MKHLLRVTCLMGLLGIISGCQCSPWTARYANRIDDISDRKMEIDGVYQPGLDVSRIGMPDWGRYGRNHKRCKNNCRKCQLGNQGVEYPAFYTLRYYEDLEKTVEPAEAPGKEYFESDSNE